MIPNSQIRSYKSVVLGINTAVKSSPGTIIDANLIGGLLCKVILDTKDSILGVLLLHEY